MTRTIFVTGSRGKTGRAVIAQLSDRDNVVVRGGTSQDALRDADTVAFDWRDQTTWAAAVDGADGVYLMRPDIPEAPELISQLSALNPSAHIVLVSEQGAETVGTSDWVRRVEDAVTGNAKSWTILRPSWFQQVLTDPRYFRDAIRDDRTISLPTGGTPIAWVDTRDIAAVAVHALLEPSRHHGKAYTLTGPEAVTVDALAHAVSSSIGHEVRSLDPPIAEALRGVDEWTGEVVGGMFGRVHDGVFGEVTNTVAQVTGQRPRTLQQFVTENHDQWRALATPSAVETRIGANS